MKIIHCPEPASGFEDDLESVKGAGKEREKWKYCVHISRMIDTPKIMM